MATLSDMHTQARRLVLHIRGNLDKFEGLEGAWRARDGMAGSAPDGDGWAGAVPGRPWDATSGLRPTSRGVTSHVGIEKTDKELMETEETARQQLWHLDAICRTLEGNWRQQVVSEGPSQRDVWQRKVEQVRADYASLHAELEHVTRRVDRRRAEEKLRAELLSRVDVNGEAERARHEFDVEGQMMQSVNSSKRVLAEALATGSAVLERMGATRERLKGAQRKALDVINSLGLSDSVRLPRCAASSGQACARRRPCEP